MESAVLLLFLGAIAALRSVSVKFLGGCCAPVGFVFDREESRENWCGFELTDAKICTSLSQRSTQRPRWHCEPQSNHNLRVVL
jgi:hypothetical protein